MDNYIFKKLNISIIKKNMFNGKGIKIAIIDEGVNNIKDKLEIAGGYNFINNSDDYFDEDGHGTAIASIIKSREFGIAQDVELYSLKVKLEFTDASINMVIKAIDWCISNKIDIINMSFGFAGFISYALEDKCEEAMNQGIVIVCAAGNNNLSQGIEIPGKYNSTIAISGVSRNNTRYEKSSFGKSVDFCCYSEDLLTYDKTGEIITIAGTSYASPCVAGIIALIKEQNPLLTPREIYELLKDNVLKLDGSRKSLYYGYGLIQAFLLPKSYKNDETLQLEDLKKNIYFPYTKINVPLGKKLDSELKFLPYDEFVNVDYTITDNAIAITDGDGFITGKTEGSTDLIAIMNKSKAAICSINVIKEEIQEPDEDVNNSNLFNLTEMNIYKMHKSGFTGKGIKIGLIGYGCIETDLINVKSTITIASDDTKDANGFGTIYASIISGKEIGIAPEAELYVVKAATKGGVITWSAAEKAVNWCIDNKMDIINLGFVNSTLYDSILKKCYSNNIIPVVNASGNISGVTVAQTSPYSITVSYVTDEKKFILNDSARTPFTGSFIDCVAYGFGIQCINSENNQVLYEEGKAPVAQYYCNLAMMQVIGIIALIKQQDPTINNAVKVRSLLPKLCEQLYGGKNDYTGYGLIKAALLSEIK